jgi:hypothetical protein
MIPPDPAVAMIDWAFYAATHGIAIAWQSIGFWMEAAFTIGIAYPFASLGRNVV